MDTAVVERGAVALDERIPTWRDLIDLDAFDLSDPQHCILGQLFGGYHNGLDVLDLDCISASEYGFNLRDDSDIRSYPETMSRYADLQELWVDEVTNARQHLKRS